MHDLLTQRRRWLRPPATRTLRSVLYHDVATSHSPFTEGIGVTVRPDVFAQRLEFLSAHYTFVGLEDVVDAVEGTRRLPRRPLLLTFDDAYGSVARHALPVLAEHRIPSVFFLNGDFVDHKSLGLDNLVCYVVNTAGADVAINACARIVPNPCAPTARAILGELIPSLRPAEVTALREELLATLDHDPLEAASDLGLYLTTDDVEALSANGVEFGNHTASHVRCRFLDSESSAVQIVEHAGRLRQLTGQRVRAFSVPYGSRIDVSDRMTEAVAAAGHDLTFLVEARANGRHLQRDAIYRVSMSSRSDVASMLEIELFPQLRRVRDWSRDRIS